MNSTGIDEAVIAENANLIFASSLFLIFLTTVIIFASLQFLKFINLKLKVYKIKKLSKKINIKNYSLKINAKGVPIMLINNTDPSDIYLV